MIRRPPRSTQSRSSAASDVYKRQVFYYISQKSERSVAFMPHDVVDQRIIAVYFDKDRRVQRLANYGLKDGKVFDFLSQTTPTGGQELRVLGQVFKNLKVEF